MKKFSLLLIILLTGLTIFNVTTINFSDSLTSRYNQHIYWRLVANVLILMSLSYSYWRYNRKSAS